MSENWREKEEAKKHFDSVPRSALLCNRIHGTKNGNRGMHLLPKRGANPQSFWEMSAGVP